MSSPNPRRCTSDIWTYFTKLDKKGQCNYCEQVIACSNGSSSNLKRHLRSKHPTAVLATRGSRSRSPSTGDESAKKTEETVAIDSIKSSQTSADAVTSDIPSNSTPSSRSVGECKDKLKNMRAVYLRPAPRGRPPKNKKPYYLTEAMQFTLPYVKVLCKEHENLANVAKQEHEVHPDDNDVIVGGDFENEEIVIGQIIEQPESQSPLLLKTQVEGGSSEVQQAKKRVTPAENSPRREALKMFLLSMLPDLESMTDNQVRHFKQTCLRAVDEILLPPTYLPCSPTSVPPHSPSPSGENN